MSPTAHAISYHNHEQDDDGAYKTVDARVLEEHLVKTGHWTEEHHSVDWTYISSMHTK